MAYLDALVIKVRDKSGARNKSVYIVVGVRPDGPRTCWACGCRRPRARNSGLRFSRGAKRFPDDRADLAPALGRDHAFLAFPAEIRRAIYTTNAIEALNRQLRKVLKTCGHMPNEQAALKLLYMAVQNAQKNWGGRDRRWNPDTLAAWPCGTRTVRRVFGETQSRCSLLHLRATRLGHSRATTFESLPK